MSSAPPPRDPRPVLLYDGECGLCDRSVQTILDADREGRIRLAALQGETGRAVLLRHGRDPEPAAGFASMILVEDFEGPGERLSERSGAVLAVGSLMGGRYRFLAGCARLAPRCLRDRVYGWVARNRHRFFPAPDACRLPTPEVRARFLP